MLCWLSDPGVPQSRTKCRASEPFVLLFLSLLLVSSYHDSASLVLCFGHFEYSLLLFRDLIHVAAVLRASRLPALQFKATHLTFTTSLMDYSMPSTTKAPKRKADVQTSNCPRGKQTCLSFAKIPKAAPQSNVPDRSPEATVTIPVKRVHESSEAYLLRHFDHLDVDIMSEVLAQNDGNYVAAYKSLQEMSTGQEPLHPNTPLHSATIAGTQSAICEAPSEDANGWSAFEIAYALRLSSDEAAASHNGIPSQSHLEHHFENPATNRLSLVSLDTNSLVSSPPTHHFELDASCPQQLCLPSTRISSESSSQSGRWMDSTKDTLLHNSLYHLTGDLQDIPVSSYTQNLAFEKQNTLGEALKEKIETQCLSITSSWPSESTPSAVTHEITQTGELGFLVSTDPGESYIDTTTLPTNETSQPSSPRLAGTSKTSLTIAACAKNDPVIHLDTEVSNTLQDAHWDVMPNDRDASLQGVGDIQTGDVNELKNAIRKLQDHVLSTSNASHSESEASVRFTGWLNHIIEQMIIHHPPNLRIHSTNKTILQSIWAEQDLREKLLDICAAMIPGKVKEEFGDLVWDIPASMKRILEHLNKQRPGFRSESGLYCICQFHSENGEPDLCSVYPGHTWNAFQARWFQHESAFAGKDRQQYVHLLGPLFESRIKIVLAFHQRMDTDNIQSLLVQCVVETLMESIFIIVFESWHDDHVDDNETSAVHSVSSALNRMRPASMPRVINGKPASRQWPLALAPLRVTRWSSKSLAIVQSYLDTHPDPLPTCAISDIWTEISAQKQAHDIWNIGKKLLQLCSEQKRQVPTIPALGVLDVFESDIIYDLAKKLSQKFPQNSRDQLASQLINELASKNIDLTACTADKIFATHFPQSFIKNRARGGSCGQHMRHPEYYKIFHDYFSNAAIGSVATTHNRDKVCQEIYSLMCERLPSESVNPIPTIKRDLRVALQSIDGASRTLDYMFSFSDITRLRDWYLQTWQSKTVTIQYDIADSLLGVREKIADGYESTIEELGRQYRAKLEEKYQDQPNYVPSLQRCCNAMENQYKRLDKDVRNILEGRKVDSKSQITLQFGHMG